MRRKILFILLFSIILSSAKEDQTTIIFEFGVDDKRSYIAIAESFGENDFLLSSGLNGILICAENNLEEVRKILEKNGASVRLHRFAKCITPLMINPNFIRSLSWIESEGNITRGLGVWRGENATYALVKTVNNNLEGIEETRSVVIIPTGK